MAGLANGGGAMEFVAIDADAHCRHACCLGHGRHLGDLTVTGLTLYASFQMSAVRPAHPRSESIDAHPRDGFLRLREGGQFLNRRLVLGNGFVTGHARTGRRESHQVTRFWIGVATQALQTDCQVRLVAIGDWLHGRCVIGQVAGHLLLRVGSSRRLPRLCVAHRK